MAKELDRLEAATARRVLRVLRAARERVSGLLSDGYRPRGESPSTYDALYAQARRSALDAEIGRLEGDLRREVESALHDAARTAQTFVSEAAGLPVVVDARVVAYSMDSAGAEIRGVAETVRLAVRRAITNAVAGGLSHGEMLSEIREALGGDATAGRVERIARQEVSTLYQQQRAAMDEQLKKQGADLIKVWISQRDDRTRDSHLEVDGQERELQDLFNVGEGATEKTPPDSKVGFAANGPLDPTLPLGERMGCRCDVLYRAREDAQQRYIKAGGKPPKEGAVRVISASQARVSPAASARLSASRVAGQ